MIVWTSDPARRLRACIMCGFTTHGRIAVPGVLAAWTPLIPECLACVQMDGCAHMHAKGAPGWALSPSLIAPAGRTLHRRFRAPSRCRKGSSETLLGDRSGGGVNG